LTADLPSAAVCYGVYDDDNIIAFCGVLHQPHGINKKIKRVCRLVVLPDYQGVGIGVRFLNIVAKMYVSQGYDFSIITSAKNLIQALRKRDDWVMIRYGASNCSSKKNAIDYKRASMRSTVKTASFYYKR
jgi:GNAT superfamily N-acetyltransferase